MSWLKIDDGLPTSVKVALAGRTKRERAETVGAAVLIWAWCAGQRTDGWVPASVVDDYAEAACRTRLTRRAFDREPMLHRRGDICPCLDGRAWPTDADYAVHDYLRYNPSRAENDVHRAQVKERKDPALKQAVRSRDGDWCRYCARLVKWTDHRGAAGGVMEHVDPKIAAGADNLVVACRGCNSRKDKRTPAEAGMTLLPPPARGADGQLLAPSAPAANPPVPPAEPARNPATDPGPEPDRDPGTDPGPDPGSPPDPAPGTAPVRAAVPASAPQPGPVAVTRVAGTTGPGRDGTGSPPTWVTAGDAGPAGHRPTVGPATTARTSDAPSPYLRTGITGPAPEDHAGLPDHLPDREPQP
ncbi:hypothetical protein AB0I55_29300 [Actinocatenispora sera]|uniref:HNH endonuclease n=1 Tax=Actinocatenispora sera TaxID=390989 RepID=UPI0033E18F75